MRSRTAGGVRSPQNACADSTLSARAVASAVLWPLSIAWAPGVARSTAEQKNYLAYRERILTLCQASQPKIAAPTRMHKVPVDPRRATAQLQRLEKLWAAGRISEGE